MARRRRAGRAAGALALVAAAVATGLALGVRGDRGEERWARVTTSGFSDPTRIDNPYLPLSRLRECVLEGRVEGTRVRIVRRLLDRTESFRIDRRRVEAAVVEDRAFEDGRLHERTLDFYAQADDGTVHYLGEDVVSYERGTVVSHDGTFRYGRDTATLGVAMPADPEVGMRWRFEHVPGVASESDRIVAWMPEARIRGRTYRDVIRVRERVLPERQAEEKLYARGAGPVREDGNVELVGCAGSASN